MQFHQLKRTHKNKKRMTVGRGGKRGKTSGRGGKGQSARAGNKRRPEWRDIIKRLPKLRGRGVNSHKTVSDAFKVVNVSLIQQTFKADEMVTPSTLVEKGVVSTFSGNIPSVKILGDGEISIAVKVSGCAVSGSAKEKIEKVGGTITPITPKVIVKNAGYAGVTGTPKTVVEPKKVVKTTKKATDGKKKEETSFATPYAEATEVRKATDGRSEASEAKEATKVKKDPVKKAEKKPAKAQK